METLETYRTAEGLTFEQLGKLIGVSKPSAWKLCAGQVNPRLDTMRRIAEKTGGRVPLDAWRATELPGVR